MIKNIIPSKKVSIVLLFLLAIIFTFSYSLNSQKTNFEKINYTDYVSTLMELSEDKNSESTDFIKWVDFTVSLEALNKAYKYDIETYDQDVHLDWIELLAYAAARCGGTFNSTSLDVIDSLADTLVSKEDTIENLTKELKYYNYYLEAYTAVLDNYIGEYEVKTSDSSSYEKKYGLIAFSPIAKGFDYSDYDDFGVSRSYGYKRQHLGHDMMGLTGTPIIVMESGYIEALGWNQYGGWRVGIRSFDKKRYYYYAHLRQNRPFAVDLEEGDIVKAGDVIGYMGHTGYSTKENVNNIDSTHLHFGIQLVFDESQKECNCEIWIDCYNLIRFLRQNRSEVVREDDTKEWYSTAEYKFDYYEEKQ